MNRRLPTSAPGVPPEWKHPPKNQGKRHTVARAKATRQTRHPRRKKRLQSPRRQPGKPTTGLAVDAGGGGVLPRKAAQPKPRVSNPVAKTSPSPKRPSDPPRRRAAAVEGAAGTRRRS